MDIDFVEPKKPVKNPLAGAIDIAIREAERYGTDLVIKTNGKIERVSPATLKQRLARER